jgi:hypothetical protein
MKGQPTHAEIANLAYYFFEERGRAHGHDVEDWLRAVAHVCTNQRHAPKERKRAGATFDP